MTETATYPKRLIEVDLPIKRISEHARREKSIRRGHISTLHIWWARRPLAACRAVLCAALWIDPADPRCPESFREVARAQMRQWAADHLGLMSNESYNRFVEIQKKPELVSDNEVLRRALLDFIADFANWDNSTKEEYLNVSRVLTLAAHEALGGIPGTRPLVVDPFAGGGAIPLEALRVGADVFASDLNPIPVLLNKVVLEYIPKYGQQLADEVQKWGAWIKAQAEKKLAEFYPRDSDGATPIAYLWARTIRCEGPGCGAEVPLMRSLWLARKAGRSVGLRLIPNVDDKRLDFDIIRQEKGAWTSTTYPNLTVTNPKLDTATVKRGSATCPVCNYTTPVVSVRKQLKERRGGAHDARLFCVVTTRPGQQGRFYRLPTDRDLTAISHATKTIENQIQNNGNPISLVPDELLDVRGIRHTWAMVYGLEQWGDYFTPRQALELTTLAQLVRELDHVLRQEGSTALNIPTLTILALAASKQADRDCSLCRWISQNENIGYTFGRQAIGMMWDFVEAPSLASGGGWKGIVDDICETISALSVIHQTGQAEQASATNSPLSNDFAQALFTDPPYYDAVPYSYLSDFFYVWLRRSLGDVHPDLFSDEAVPKDNEIVVDRPHALSTSNKDITFYESELTKAFADGRRVLAPNGIATIVFASKTTTIWKPHQEVDQRSGNIMAAEKFVMMELQRAQ